MSVDINVSITEDQVDIIANPTLNIINVTSSAAISWGFINGTLSNQTDLQNALNAKQNTLVSGSNIKTLEGQSLLGSGNIDLTKSDVGLANVDNTSDANKPISTATQTALNAKQDTLVSGTNIKTVNGTTLLGSGDFLTIPQLTSVQRDALTPVAGYPIYNTTEGYLETYDNFWGWMPVAQQNEWKRKWGFEYFQDFGVNSALADGVITVVVQNGGGAGVSSGTFPTTNDFIGLQGFRTGNLSNAAVSFRTDINSGRFVYFSGGKLQLETRVWLQTLSTTTDRYNLIFGFTNGFNSTITNGVAFVYDEGGVGAGTLATPNWQIVTANGGIRTVINTGIPVAINTFYTLRIDINDANTEAKYYLNSTLVYTATTNLPTGQIFLSITSAITKTTGTNNINVLYDYFGIKKKFTTPR